ncbi:MAG: FHA domain-containing protein [Chlorobiaceae bacterium]|nr:FHA domain-containing protein [Chlorobiaceae bacterium]
MHPVELRQAPFAWWIKDLQSTNGTYVAGVRIDRVQLEDHTRFGFVWQCW